MIPQKPTVPAAPQQPPSAPTCPKHPTATPSTRPRVETVRGPNRNYERSFRDYICDACDGDLIGSDLLGTKKL